jgi:ribosomal peptide maturation radical SAM protein 1
MALARRIKEAHPQVEILFGGSNFDGEMGLEFLRKVDWIDHAVVGEGDLAFPELLVALSEGTEPSTLAGVASRVDGEVRYGGARRLFDRLDELPTPTYEEYFRRAEQTGLLTPSRRRTTLLPFESARGCWWGEKHHCTFCGLNNNGMKFRSKSPDRVAGELSELARENRSFNFTAVDNIVEQDYLKTLFPRLVEEEKGYSFFYEVKANLTRAQIRDMRLAGVMAIQPGIESLSTNVLRLMRKGITASQNVNTLRWATYYGVHVAWNMLWGFPNEALEDYESQAGLIPLLTHLAPPGGGAQIRMERFSPLFTDQEMFPLEFRRPEASYSYVYPKAIDLEKVAYFFDHELKNTLDTSAYDGVKRELAAWRRAWTGADAPDGIGAGDGARAARPSLTFCYSDEFLQISDTRRPSNRGSFTFEGPLARLYKSAVDRPVSAKRAIELSGVAFGSVKVEHALDEFCERGVMMRDGDKFLALALPSVAGR